MKAILPFPRNAVVLISIPCGVEPDTKTKEMKPVFDRTLGLLKCRRGEHFIIQRFDAHGVLTEDAFHSSNRLSRIGHERGIEALLFAHGIAEIPVAIGSNAILHIQDRVRFLLEFPPHLARPEKQDSDFHLWFQLMEALSVADRLDFVRRAYERWPAIQASRSTEQKSSFIIDLCRLTGIPSTFSVYNPTVMGRGNGSC